jgi:hypothetical protein
MAKALSTRARLNRLLDVADLLHFKDLGEIDDIDFEWWWFKFKPHLKRVSAQRAWERRKAAMRELGVPLIVVREEGGRHPVRLLDGAKAYIEQQIDAIIAANPRVAAQRKRWREKQRKWRKANPEKVREIRQRYAAKHPEMVKAARARYEERHPDRVRETRRRSRKKHYAANREEIIRKSTQWKKDNPTKARVIQGRWNDKNKEKREGSGG